ncbi:MAG: siderophore-interacting protein [Actinomycetota bacterium]|nr:siderophore-interacting protein [Actinomycetota bacterium]
MTSRAAAPMRARVLERRDLSEHLVRLRLGGLAHWVSTGIPDEWVALTVPGQFQTRYYTVRSFAAGELVLDVVLHEEGLVTEWARTGCVGDEVGVSEPMGSFTLPDDATWAVLVGDLTALPAIARITERLSGKPFAPSSYVEAPDGTAHAYPDLTGSGTTWLAPPSAHESALAEVVRGIDWSGGPGYFWMAGESAQMRDIRRHLRHDLGFESGRYDVMGYWSGSRGRRMRAVDPAPIYARGKREGRSDEQIWSDYDAARDS